MLDVSSLTIERAAKAYRTGEFSPVDLVETYLARIEQLNSVLNAYVTVTAAAARSAAEQATDELRRGIDRGPLHGIPIAYKDLYATAGIRTTAGSGIHAQRIPLHDAAVVTRLAHAGAIMLGKQNMHEFAFGVVHPDFGPAKNPWNFRHASGGSSNGSAVAVAAGLCLAALGSDTGGSIRLPAAWTGLVGLKPTFGLVSRVGVDPLSQSLDHVGPLTRTSRDAALMLNAIAGYDPRDEGSARDARFDMAEVDAVDVSTLKVGVPEHLLEDISSEVRQGFDAALDRMRGLGMRVERIKILGTDQLAATRKTITLSEASAYHAKWISTRRSDYSANFLARIAPGAEISAVDYLHALRARAVSIAAYERLFREVDLLAMPTTPTTAPLYEPPTSGVSVAPGASFQRPIGTMEMFNVTGGPAISIVSGWSSDGLPLA
ncbi:MAG TPA: amidase, partial [Nitrolancea sp.]|nr:amidase [Nitrolancea sp.]